MSLACTTDLDADAGGNTVFWMPSLYAWHTNHGQPERCEGCKERIANSEPVYTVPRLRFPFVDGWAENMDEYGISYWRGHDLLAEFEENEIEIERDISGNRIDNISSYYWLDENSAWDDLVNVVIPANDIHYFEQSCDITLGLSMNPPSWTTMCRKCMHVQWALDELEFCYVPLNRHKALAEYREYCEERREWARQEREEKQRAILSAQHRRLR